MQPRTTSLQETIPPESEECLCKGKHTSQNLNRPNTTRVACKTSEVSFSPYPSSPWWWPNYGQGRQRLVCKCGAVHLCAITQRRLEFSSNWNFGVATFSI